MGLTRDLSEALIIASLPKVAIVAPPTDALLLDGSVLRAGDSNLTVRMLSMEQPHRAVPITGAICLAIASRITGTIVADQTCASSGPLTLAHPSGSITVDATIEQSGPVPYAVSGSAYRTARVLFSGNVHW
jgi:2-methylaconitate cis-trans-isomerase PrpF